MAQCCPPLDKDPNTIDSTTAAGMHTLRRMLLERIGWQLWNEDDHPEETGTRYCYWRDPQGRVDPNAQTPGLYKHDPEFHWFPPEVNFHLLLRQYPWEMKFYPDTKLGAMYEVTIHSPWGISGATMFTFDVAVYHALLEMYRMKEAAHDLQAGR